MVSLPHTLVYKPGQAQGKEDTLVLPLLSRFPVIHGISFGPSAANMAEKFSHEETSAILRRQERWLTKNGFSPLSSGFLSIVPSSGSPKIVDITHPRHASVKKTETIEADTLFTQLSHIPLLHKPADCPTAIIYAEDNKGVPLVGIAHLGRPQVNNRVVEATLNHLITHYQAPREKIMIGISPSIGPKYYFLRMKDQETKKLIDLAYWGEFAYADSYPSESIIRIDILGKIISLFNNYALPPENIQAYGYDEAVDTYFLASQKIGFSHRFATSTNQPDKNGRFLVAVELISQRVPLFKRSGKKG